MRFMDIVAGLILGLLIPYTLVMMTSQSDFSRKTRNYFYSFFSIAYLFFMAFYWFREDFGYTVGLGLIGAFWLKIWYSEAKQATMNEQRATNGEKPIEIEDSLASRLRKEKKMDVSRLVFGALVFWVLVFLGTFISWNDYVYFYFVRIIAMFIAIIMIEFMTEISAKISKPFLGGFILMIIIYNPLILIKLNRATWQVVDVLVILLLVSFYRYVKKKVKKRAMEPNI